MHQINEKVQILGGQLELPGISNGTGTVALISTIDGKTLVTRTKEQFIQDYELATTLNIANEYVPKIRSLTINGTTQDLSTNRTWAIDTKSNLSLGSITDTSITINNSNGSGLLVTVANQTQAGLLSSTLYNKIFDNEANLGKKHTKDLSANIYNGSDARQNTSWFDYNWAGTSLLGSVINFSGLSNEGYNVELFGSYLYNGNEFYLRSRNGDTNKWYLPRRVWTDGDFLPTDVDSWKLAARASHVHDNKARLDVINQNLSTTSSPIFNGVQIGYVTGPFKGFNSTQSFSFLNAGNAQTISTGGVLISDDYQDTTFIPVSGMYSKGTISTKTHGNSSLWKMAYDLSLANIALDGLVFDGTTLKVNAVGKEVFEKTTKGGLRVIDWNSSANALNAIAIGAGSNAGAFNALAMMNGANAYGNTSIAIGLQSVASASHSVAFGNYSSSLAPYGVVLGYGSTNTQAGCTVIGNFARPLQNEVEISTNNTFDKPILIIGNGISSTLRSNSHEFYRDGSTKNYGRQYYDEANRHLIDFTKDNTLVDVEYVKNNGGGGLPNDPWSVLINDFDYAGDVIENPEITVASGGQYPIYYMLESNTQGDNVWAPWDNGGIQNATGLLFGYYIASKKLMLIRGYVNDPTVMINPHNSSSMYIEYIQNQDIYTTVNVAYSSFVKYRDIRLGNVISGNKHILYFNPK